MPELRVFPDAALLAVSVFTARLPGAYFCTKLPPGPQFNTLLPGGIVRVMRIGGVPIYRRHLDNPNLSLDLYAPDEPTVNDLIKQVRAVVGDMEDATGDGGRITWAGELTGPAERPEEPNTGVVRFGMSIELITRPD